ncbi:MAG: PIN domain-containing protein [Acidobacteria bacterium]|nr:MAG: PIN domain-containing protein [Acidobacteriota bacterium]
MKFWDSSAIVPLLVKEASTESLLKMLEGDQQLLVWWGTPVECTSALARREREGSMPADQTTAAIERLVSLATAWDEVAPSVAVRSQARRLVRLHPLRAADALQLAAAVVAAEHEPASLEIVTLDERLRTAAEREGFHVIMP